MRRATNWLAPAALAFAAMCLLIARCGRVYKTHPPEAAFSKTTLSASLIAVVDGDTLKVSLGQRWEFVRLIGIDAPESSENDKALRDADRSGKDLKAILALGAKARAHCRSLAHRGDRLALELDMEQRDKYDRLLAYVYLPDGTFLNERMLQDGFAQPLSIAPNLKYAEHFKAMYRQARAAKRGLWANE